MKKAAFCLVFLSLMACKKEDDSRYATHIFWIDKSTSDSLIANGFDQLELTAPNIVLGPNDVYRRITSSSNWDGLKPSSAASYHLMVSRQMEPGDTTSFAYEIIAKKTFGQTGTDSVSLTNSSGRLRLSTDITMTTELSWQ